MMDGYVTLICDMCSMTASFEQEELDAAILEDVALVCDSCGIGTLLLACDNCMGEEVEE